MLEKNQASLAEYLTSFNSTTPSSTSVPLGLKERINQLSEYVYWPRPTCEADDRREIDEICSSVKPEAKANKHIVLRILDAERIGRMLGGIMPQVHEAHVRFLVNGFLLR
jgi:hypothetical protein